MADHYQTKDKNNDWCIKNTSGRSIRSTFCLDLEHVMYRFLQKFYMRNLCLRDKYWSHVFAACIVKVHLLTQADVFVRCTLPFCVHLSLQTLVQHNTVIVSLILYSGRFLWWSSVKECMHILERYCVTSCNNTILSDCF